MHKNFGVVFGAKTGTDGAEYNSGKISPDAGLRALYEHLLGNLWGNLGSRGLL